MKWISAVFLSLLTTVAFAAPQVTASGHWKTFDDKTGKAKGEVIIYEEDGLYYGKIGRSLTPEDEKEEKGGTEYCTKCPGEFKDKKVEGLRFMWDFKRNGDNYRGGKILDPETGDIYNANLRLEDDDTLILRGYVGIPMFGRSQTWKRMTADEVKESEKLQKAG